MCDAVLQTKGRAKCLAWRYVGDSVAEAPVLRRGFAEGCGPQGAGGHFGLLLVCGFFANAQLPSPRSSAQYLQGFHDDLIRIVQQVVKAILRKDSTLEVRGDLSNSPSTRVTLSKRFSIREILSILACLSIFYLLFQFQIKGFIKDSRNQI